MWDVHCCCFFGPRPGTNFTETPEFAWSFVFFLGGAGWLSTKKDKHICTRSGMVYQLGSTYRLFPSPPAPSEMKRSQHHRAPMIQWKVSLNFWKAQISSSSSSSSSSSWSNHHHGRHLHFQSFRCFASAHLLLWWGSWFVQVDPPTWAGGIQHWTRLVRRGERWEMH